MCTVFGATFPSVKATTYYSTAPTVALGGGSIKDAKIPKNSKYPSLTNSSSVEFTPVNIQSLTVALPPRAPRSSTVHFPMQLNYTTTIDPSFAIITDIAEKCGFVGSSASDLTVDYKINLKVKVIVVTIPISSVLSAPPPPSADTSADMGVRLAMEVLGQHVVRVSGVRVGH